MYRKLSEICEIRRGASPRPISDPKYFGGNVGWVRISDVTASNKYLRYTEDYVSELGEKNSVRVNKGDLILSICATIGRPVIIDFPACIHDGFVQFYNLKNINTEFLFYSLQFSEDKLKSSGQSGTQTNLNTSIVGNLKIYIPDILEQTKIASVLATIDIVIEQTEALVIKYQNIKSGLMFDLLTHGIDKKGIIRNEQTHKFKDSPLGKIPVEWESKQFGDIYTDFRTGSTPSRSNPKYFEGDILWVTSGELKYKTILDTIEKITPEAVRDTRLKIYPPGTFFFAITGLEAEGTRGSCAIIGKEATTNQSCMAFEENATIHNPYLYQYYRYWGKTISLRFAQGTKQQSLNSNIVSRIWLHVPPKEEQKQIALLLEKYDQTIEKEIQYLNKLKSLKSGLMSDLLTGKVKATVDTL